MKIKTESIKKHFKTFEFFGNIKSYQFYFILKDLN